MIPIPVEVDAMLAILNLPKEMSNNDIFREHQGLVMEMIRSIVMQQFYEHETNDELSENNPQLPRYPIAPSLCHLATPSPRHPVTSQNLQPIHFSWH
ncbi:MAG: hypothetical protein PHH07_06175 [Candidatus Cloacimonetes bacterium]|nr:hypothetical protein [Candidatus Cloacimonadota bacterium]